MDLNDKALGYSGYSSYNHDRDNNVGIAKDFDKQYELDIIGTNIVVQELLLVMQEEFLIIQNV